jgi:hypothetical protein
MSGGPPALSSGLGHCSQFVDAVGTHRCTLQGRVPADRFPSLSLHRFQEAGHIALRFDDPLQDDVFVWQPSDELGFVADCHRFLEK